MKAKIIEALEKIHVDLSDFWNSYADLEEDSELEFSDFEALEKFDFNVFDHWLGGPEHREKEVKLSQEFIGIGQSGDGSLAAIWLLKGKNLSNAPVVLIGSEGEIGVIAPNYLTFMLLIAQGFDMCQLVDFEEKIWHSPRPQFALYLKKHFNLNPILNVAEMVKQAKNEHPDLEEYVSAFF